MKKNLANLITISRIVGTVALIPCEVPSYLFYGIYIWCGLSDILDGFVARMFKSQSELGSKLDSVSDLLFYSVMMLKVWRFLRKGLPQYVWIMIYVIVFARFLAYIFVGVRDKVFESRHTPFNKVTGAVLFLLPFFIETPYLIGYSLVVLAIAYFSYFEELHHIFLRPRN